VIHGLGVDIVEIDRMREALERRPRIKERCFSEEERSYCDERSRPEIHYATRFAAKEAVLKALGTGFGGMRFTDVGVARDERGRPTPVLSGRAAELAQELGITELHVSLSYTHVTAVASAVAIVPDPPAETEPTQEERLAASFKQARTVLDDIETGPAVAGREAAPVADGADVPVAAEADATTEAGGDEGVT
jgi:holo-[acyl-carrier protein] synthase